MGKDAACIAVLAILQMGIPFFGRQGIAPGMIVIAFGSSSSNLPRRYR